MICQRKLLPSEIAEASTPKAPTIDKSPYRKQLMKVIVRATLSGQLTAVEKAIQALKDHCPVRRMLDYVPDKELQVRVTY